MIKAGIIGASGYGGGELARILSAHPDVQLIYISSKTYEGRSIGSALPNMRGLSDLTFQAYDPEAAARCDVIFMAQHNGWAMKEAGALLAAGVKVIDLSADFRLKDPAAYAEWYKLAHASPSLLPEAVYGLPEINREKIAGARLVANPGCYPTSAILALAPLLSAGLAENVVIDSSSGVSGAGRSTFSLDYHFPELNESMRAYKVGTHRHTPEIEQEISGLAGVPMTVSFTPHLVPITRGILTTAYASCARAEVHELYREFYKDAPFVVLLDPGEYPATKATVGGNFCHIGIAPDPRTGRVVAISAIDNLVKGAAGQAVQNMNLMCGLDETAGLRFAGAYP
ncbi:MAG: N-acetyl-gamma-glutamyl-phosphate reductase [Armatimonadota bacterium]